MFTSSQLGSFLNNKGGLWASLAIGALGVLTYEATTLCSSDPPTAPTLTSTDYKALLQLEPFDEFTTALGKLKDLVTRALWFDLCECSAGTTPPPPTGLLDPPAGVTLPDYGLTPCAQPRLRIPIRPPLTVFSNENNITREAFPNLETAVSVQGGADEPPQTIARLPSSWTNAYGTSQLVSGSTPLGQAYATVVSLYDINRSNRTGLVTSSASSQVPFQRDPPTGAAAVPSTARYFAINNFANPQVTTTGTVDWTLNITCGSATVTQPGCCQDPVLYGLINALTQQVTLVRRDTELLQRYGLPFASVAGTQHTGLTGTGSAALTRSVGLHIEVTAMPVGLTQLTGQPPYIFDLGWISVLTPDGLLDEMRLTRTATSWMSKLIPSATVVGWGLREGVAVTITELRPEP